jgi:hypothetical protein
LWTVHEGLADGLRAQCSSRVLRVLARLRFRSIVVSSFVWARFRTVCVCRADSPRMHGGQSACSPRTVRYLGSPLEVLFAFSDSPRLRDGRSAVRVRTVRGSRPDSLRGLCGQSAPFGQTVRQSLAAFFLGSIPPSFFRASTCASRNRSKDLRLIHNLVVLAIGV